MILSIIDYKSEICVRQVQLVKLSNETWTISEFPLITLKSYNESLWMVKWTSIDTNQSIPWNIFVIVTLNKDFQCETTLVFTHKHTNQQTVHPYFHFQLYSQLNQKIFKEIFILPCENGFLLHRTSATRFQIRPMFVNSNSGNEISIECPSNYYLDDVSRIGCSECSACFLLQFAVVDIHDDGNGGTMVNKSKQENEYIVLDMARLLSQRRNRQLSILLPHHLVAISESRIANKVICRKVSLPHHISNFYLRKLHIVTNDNDLYSIWISQDKIGVYSFVTFHEISRDLPEGLDPDHIKEIGTAWGSCNSNHSNTIIAVNTNILITVWSKDTVFLFRLTDLSIINEIRNAGSMIKRIDEDPFRSQMILVPLSISEDKCLFVNDNSHKPFLPFHSIPHNNSSTVVTALDTNNNNNIEINLKSVIVIFEFQHGLQNRVYSETHGWKQCGKLLDCNELIQTKIKSEKKKSDHNTVRKRKRIDLESSDEKSNPSLSTLQQNQKTQLIDALSQQLNQIEITSSQLKVSITNKIIFYNYLRHQFLIRYCQESKSIHSTIKNKLSTELYRIHQPLFDTIESKENKIVSDTVHANRNNYQNHSKKDIQVLGITYVPILSCTSTFHSYDIYIRLLNKSALPIFNISITTSFVDLSIFRGSESSSFTFTSSYPNSIFTYDSCPYMLPNEEIWIVARLNISHQFISISNPRNLQLFFTWQSLELSKLSSDNVMKLRKVVLSDLTRASLEVREGILTTRTDNLDGPLICLGWIPGIVSSKSLKGYYSQRKDGITLCESSYTQSNISIENKLQIWLEDMSLAGRAHFSFYSIYPTLSLILLISSSLSSQDILESPWDLRKMLSSILSSNQTNRIGMETLLSSIAYQSTSTSFNSNSSSSSNNIHDMTLIQSIRQLLFDYIRSIRHMNKYDQIYPIESILYYPHSLNNDGNTTTSSQSSSILQSLLICRSNHSSEILRQLKDLIKRMEEYNMTPINSLHILIDVGDNWRDQVIEIMLVVVNYLIAELKCLGTQYRILHIQQKQNIPNIDKNTMINKIKFNKTLITDVDVGCMLISKRMLLDSIINDLMQIISSLM